MTSLIEYLCERIKSSYEFNNHYRCLLNELATSFFEKNKCEFLFSEHHQRLLHFSEYLSNSGSEQNRAIALKIISGVNELFADNSYTKAITKSILTKFGLFSAVTSFTDSSVSLSTTSTILGDIRKTVQTIPSSELSFTNRQYDIYNEILTNNFFSFSGPTSLGKSFVIKNCAIDLLDKFQMIVFILPTKALLEEYLVDFRAMLNERKIEHVNVTKSVSGVKADTKNIMIFTQERYNNFLYEANLNDIKVDVLFIDEAHKLADKSSKRSMTLYKVISHSLEKYSNLKLVFSSPVITNPQIFFKYFNITGSSLSIAESPVAQSLFFANIGNKEYKYFDTVTKVVVDLNVSDTFDSDFDLILKIGSNHDSNLIYVSSKSQCVNKAIEFAEYLNSKKIPLKVDDELINEAKLISDFIHKDFSLPHLLKYGIAYHHGNLPSFIRKRIEFLYANKKIKYIFCTSTLLEGVNLPTKNVFIYPFGKANNNSGFSLDFWNLAGRAGRYKNELTGNIICIGNGENTWCEFESSVSSKDKIEIDDEISPLLKAHRKILNYLNESVQNPDPKVVEISTMILSEVLTYLNEGKIGGLLETFDSKVRQKIISAGREHLTRKNILGIDISTFSENHRFDSNTQSSAYKLALNKNNTLTTFQNEDVKRYLKKINDVYEIVNPKGIVPFHIMTYSWLMGEPISAIINNSIKYSKSVRDVESFSWVDFDKNNPQHLNQKILEVINTIETDITFKLESALAHYHQLCKSIHGEDSSGINLSKFVDYGTVNPKEMSLQEYGFSRAAASELLRKYRHLIEFDNKDQLIEIKTKTLVKVLDNNGLVKKEIEWLNL
ncbi:DEAD/DEAH box helicase [Pantoea ananatis]|uniref:DEAD/DEAH box helicase n=1 Tax=Pantoea ananas TaxID=553 RepID=UPI001FF131D2|nr:DEAD/DEAH box helicase [Pantoea ananatis]MCK0554770.1 DEAD/DEAH box helicase [Pantoea ananatis]